MNRAFIYCRVQWVVVYTVNRFSRNAHDHLATRAFLGGLGDSLRSVTETIDESSLDKFMESFMADRVEPRRSRVVWPGAPPGVLSVGFCASAMYLFAHSSV